MKTLFIGSTVLDMVINVDHLPKLKEDINTDSMRLSIGGCAYNACRIVKQYNLDAVLCSPIGTGLFADLLSNLLDKENIKPFVKLENRDNGCCICLVNKDGERTFLCQHGAEYSFNRNWLNKIDEQEIDYIYVCGLEIEDVNGEEILGYLEDTKAKIFFAPGSRIMNIQHKRMDRILNLHPILHLNEEEALEYTKCENVRKASEALYAKTQELVIITCGPRGAYFNDGKCHKLVEGYSCVVKDTIGAGDSHAGACIAGLKLNLNIEKIIQNANKIASKVVSNSGATLTDLQFKEAIEV